MAEYYFPTDDSQAQAVTLSAYSTGVIVPLFTKPLSWYYTGSALSVSAVYIAGGPYGNGPYGQGPYPIGPLASTCGFSASCADPSGGVYLTQYTGSLVHLTSGGIFTSHNLPSTVTLGVAFNITYQQPYVVENNGTIYTQSGTGLISVGSYYPSGGLTYGSGYYGSGLYSSFALGVSSVWALETSGSTLFSYAPGNLLAFTLSSSSGGSGIPIAAPIEVPLCMAVSPSGFVALGGWNQATIGSGVSGIINVAFDTVNSNLLALRPAPSSRVDLYNGPGEVWSYVQSLSGITNPENAAWGINGVNSLVTDSVTGAAYGLTYALNSISITSTVTGLADAGAVTIQPDGITAFVCQPTQNKITQLDLVGASWTAGATFALTGASTLISTSSGVVSGLAVGYASGVAFLSGNNQSYSIIEQTPLTYTPTALALDAAYNLLACGTSGSLGVLTHFSGQSSGAPVTWSGSALGMIYDQGQVVVLDGVNNDLHYLGRYTGVPYSVYNTTGWTLTSGISGIAINVSPLTANASGGTVFVMSSGASGFAYLSHFVGPFNLFAAASGVVGIYSSGLWTTVALAERDAPTALTFDTSGNISVATRNNLLYSIATSGTVRSSTTIPVYTGQTQTTALGISNMTVALGHVWGSSSFNGSLIELI